MRKIILIAHNIRSTHNVGSLLRTADGLGVSKVYFTGYTPYPLQKADTRLPHIARKLNSQISKTALGAETSQSWEARENVSELFDLLKNDNYRIVALEQNKDSTPMPTYRPPQKLALIIGREVEGLEPEILARCQDIVEIPMFGQKESFNVVQAGAMALYHFVFYPFRTP